MTLPSAAWQSYPISTRTLNFFIVSKTDKEVSLVCLTKDVPERTVEQSDGWRGFRTKGILDFSLVGILSKLSAILAENKIGIFSVSTFNTDYILVKAENFERAMEAVSSSGYEVATVSKSGSDF